MAQEIVRTAQVAIPPTQKIISPTTEAYYAKNLTTIMLDDAKTTTTTHAARCYSVTLPTIPTSRTVLLIGKTLKIGAL